jgi:hypothetical protein
MARGAGVIGGYLYPLGEDTVNAKMVAAWCELKGRRSLGNRRVPFALAPSIV